MGLSSTVGQTLVKCLLKFHPGFRGRTVASRCWNIGPEPLLHPGSYSRNLSSACSGLPPTVINHLASGRSDGVLGSDDVLRRFSLPFRMVSHQQQRGVKVSASDLRVGHIVDKKGRLYEVIKAQHVTQGRGGASMQVELRDVQSGLKSSDRYRAAENIEKVFVDERQYQYLYSEEDGSVVLSEPETYEQLTFSRELFGERLPYLTDAMPVTVHLFNGVPLAVSLPERVTCTVADTDPYFKGQTITASYKKAQLDNGIQVQVPPHVVKGDKVVVNTADHTYVTRDKS